MKHAIKCLQNQLLNIDQHLNGILSFCQRSGAKKEVIDLITSQCKELYVERDEILEAIEILEKFNK